MEQCKEHRFVGDAIGCPAAELPRIRDTIRLNVDGRDMDELTVQFDLLRAIDAFLLWHEAQVAKDRAET